LEISQPTFPLEQENNIKYNIKFKNDDDKNKYYLLRKELFSLQTYKHHNADKIVDEMMELIELTEEDTGYYDYFYIGDDHRYRINVSETGVCILGGINLGHTTLERLPIVSELMVRFLDEIIDYNKYLTNYMEKAATMRRGVGIGC